MSFLDEAGIAALGLRAVGTHVEVDESARIYRPEYVAIGSHTRIDAYSVISGGPSGVTLGDHVHLAVRVTLFGSSGLTIDDFAGLSAGVTVYSGSDDFTGGALTGPTVDPDLRDVRCGPVRIGRHVIIGAGSVVLPGVSLGPGSSVGALSLVSHSLSDGEVVAGVPARTIGRRPLERLAELERVQVERDLER